MKKPDKYNKLRGGYYTPQVISDSLVSLVVSKPTDKILEPSCGDGAFLKSAENMLLKLGLDRERIATQLIGVEIDENEAAKASSRTAADVRVGDFFKVSEKCIGQFDCVVGNPPFVRYQNVEKETRELAFEQMRREGFHPTRLSNLWLPFLAVSSLCLNENGRLAMVIPAELMQVDYSKEMRQWLMRYYARVSVVTFKRLVFDGIQQDVILLICEKRCTEKGIRFLELDGVEDLPMLAKRLGRSNTRHSSFSDAKWIRYYLNDAELSLLQELEECGNIPLASDLMEVNVGLVTGQNDFFLLDDVQVSSRGLADFVVPILSRTDRAPGLLFTKSDFERAAAMGKKVYMFHPAQQDFDALPDEVKLYIQYGEDKGYDATYKCRIRKRWFNVPESWKPEAFMVRQANLSTRIILNDAGAVNTDTLHKVRFKDGVNGQTVASAFQNSFTLLLSETIGRGYGGGVLTFEPGEARRLRIPLTGAEALDLSTLDELQRRGANKDLLNMVDKAVLKNGLGLTLSDIDILRNAWHKLSGRRLKRK